MSDERYDVIFTDTVGTRAKRQRMTARVRLVLGDSISFKGFNFTADLGGDLLAVALPQRPATGSGTIIIKEGHYKAYGQDLTISDGQLRFAGGPVDNPGLAIRATRTAEDSVVAGVQIAGPSWKMTQGQWEWLLGVNLWGVIHGVSAFVPQMLAQGDECHIVNTSSMSGLLSVPNGGLPSSAW